MPGPDPANIAGELVNCYAVQAPAPQDTALAALALRYAQRIDKGEDILKLGPLLQSALESLQLSPRSRAAVQKGMKSHDDATAKPPTLDEIAERRARKSRPEDLDALAP